MKWRYLSTKTPAGEALALAKELHTMHRITISERAAFERALCDQAHDEAVREFAKEDFQKPRE